jgi:hypothetical protein
MANKRTVGYVVVGGLGEPLIWYESENQFFRFNSSSASFFPPGRYEDARRLIGRHYRTMNQKLEQAGETVLKHLTGLRVVRLTNPS